MTSADLDVYCTDMDRNPIPLRLDDALRTRLDQLVKAMCVQNGGVRVTMSDVLRATIGRGIDVFEKELGLSSTRR